MTLAEFFAQVQSGGGMLVGLMWIGFELRALKRDVAQHEKLFKHEPREQ